jgi:hypothetical protein
MTAALIQIITGGSPALPGVPWAFFSHRIFNPALPVAPLTPGYSLAPLRGLRLIMRFPTETIYPYRNNNLVSLNTR